MNVLQKAPNVVVVCVTVLVGLAIAGEIVLAATGKPATDFTQLINNILTGLSVVGGGGALLYAGASARSAHNTEQQLNGSLDKRISDAIQTALSAHDAEVHGVSPSVPPPLNASDGKQNG